MQNNMMIINSKFIVFLIVISTFILTISFFKEPKISGDGHEYYMMTQSFYNHATPDMQKEDILDAKMKSKLLNIFYPYIDEMDKHGYYSSFDNKLYSYHFFAYSLFATPVKFILNIFEQNDFKSYQILNSILFVFMLWIVYIKYSIDNKKRNLLILFLLLNPVIYYLDWTHPEVYTYVFVVLSLTFFHNKNYKTSFVFMSIASWQNPPVLIFSIYVFLYNTIINLKVKKFKTIILEGLSLSVSLFPILFYFYNFGVLNLIAAVGYSSPNYISFLKIFDLFFGLAHGMVVFYPFILLVFFYLILKNFFLRERFFYNYLYIISIIIISILVTTTPNWNSGMDYIIRYSIWIYPFIIFYIFNSQMKIYDLFKLNFLHTIFFIILFIFYKNFFDIKFNTVSKLVLNNYPFFYITDEETFAENVLEKGINLYGNNEEYFPVLYENTDLKVRKILTDFNSLDKILEKENYKVDLDWLKKTKEKHLYKKGLFFINVYGNEISRNKWSWSVKELPTIIGKKEKDLILSDKKEGVLSFGPYIKLPNGKYQFIINYICSNIKEQECGNWDIATEIKIIKQEKIYGTNNTESYISSMFEITDELSNKTIEIRSFYNGIGDLSIKKLSIMKVE